MWEAGQVLTRAESCDTSSSSSISQVSQAKPYLPLKPSDLPISCDLPKIFVPENMPSVLSLDKDSNLSIGGVLLDDIKIGSLSEMERKNLIKLLIRFK